MRKSKGTGFQSEFADLRRSLMIVERPNLVRLVGIATAIAGTLYGDWSLVIKHIRVVKKFLMMIGVWR